MRLYQQVEDPRQFYLLQILRFLLHDGYVHLENQAYCDKPLYLNLLSDFQAFSYGLGQRRTWHQLGEDAPHARYRQ